MTDEANIVKSAVGFDERRSNVHGDYSDAYTHTQGPYD